MTEPTTAYDPTEGLDPDLTGASGEPELSGDLDDLPLEADVADVVEQHTGVTAGAQEHRGRDAGSTGATGEDLGDAGALGDEDDE